MRSSRNMRVKRALRRILKSPLLRLAIVFIGMIFVSGTLVFLLELKRNGREFTSILDGLWWATVTFSTTGYGDVVPITTTGRAIAALSIFFGIGATSVLSGTLASIFVERSARTRRGFMDFPHLKNHYIICGWREHMTELLLDILNSAPELTSDSLLLISNVDGGKISELKKGHELSSLNFIRGDYFSEATLERANIRSARKIFVLAESVEPTADAEVSSKTVMAVLSIRAITKDVYICAELLDRKYEPYLKQAMCDEILFSNDFGRHLVASATINNGMAHIVNALLSVSSEAGSRLTTVDIPPTFIGRTYRDLQHEYQIPGGGVVIGVLENTGSPNAIKMEALRQAQKTSDTSTLINNIQAVKGLEFNKPVLTPSAEYPLHKYSKAIVIAEMNGDVLH